MRKAGKDARINFILTELRKGIERKDILQKFAKVYKVSVKTFDNVLKIAKEQLAVENKAIEETRLATTKQSTIDAVNEAIVSDLELEGILSTIATGNIKIEDIVKGEAVLRGVSPMEQIAAADKLFRKRGSYAPNKIANTDTSGKDLPPSIDYNNMSPEDLEALISLHEKYASKH